MIARRHLLQLSAAMVAARGAQAQEVAADGRLVIGFSDRLSSLDPQLNNVAGDRSASLHIFDLLVENRWNRLQPGLCLPWKLRDELTWEFPLRRDVTWHDGTPFTADDVIFSYERAPNVPGSLASFAGYLRTVAGLEAPDPHTLVVRTKTPNPLLPLNLASVHIVSRRAAEGARSEDFNSGRAAIGTGPYRFVAYTQGSEVNYRASETYWGDKPGWAQISYRYMSNPAARTAALLAGDAHVIDKVSVSDIEELRKRPEIAIFPHPGLRVLLLLPSFHEGPNPNLRDKAGQVLAANPLRDVRVRRALSLAIDRAALVDRMMLGTAVAAGQVMPSHGIGYDPSIPVPDFDAAAARRLLAEAGFPEGFQLTLQTPSDAYPRQRETIQAIGQYWTRIGVRTEIESMPASVYANRVVKGEFAMPISTWGNGTGEATYALTNVLGSYDRSAGRGAINHGRYKSDVVDAALEEAMRTFDDDARVEVMRRAARAVADDVGVIPVYHYQNVWAARRGLVITPMTSDRTAAQMVTRAAS